MVFPSVVTFLEAALQPTNAFGALGVAFGCLAGLMPRRRLILAGSGACSACFGLHNLMLGSTTGAILCGLSVLQSLLACAAPEEGKRPVWLMVVLGAAALLAVAMTALTWQGVASLCAGLGSVVAALARFQGDSGRMRCLFLVSGLCWFGHNGLIGSACGLLCDLLSMTGHLCGLRQHRVRRVEAAMRLQPA